MRFRIDAPLFEGISPTREREWRQALVDLNTRADGEPPTVTIIRKEVGIAFRVEFDQGWTQDVRLSPRSLQSHMREYRGVINQLTSSDVTAFGRRSFETLDYAKKLVHDEGGEFIQRALDDLAPVDLDIGRRLFTLVFLVCSELPSDVVARHKKRRMG